MKSLVAAGACHVVVLSLLSLCAGCADEDAEGPAIAYPVGTSVPPAQPPEGAYGAAPAPAQPPVVAPAAYGPQGGEVVIGEDSDEQPPAPPAPPPPPPPPYGDEPPADQGAPPGAYGPSEADGAAVSDADPSALGAFRPALDPYGSWVDDPTYGTVWVPSPSAVGPDFTPYVTAGHWAYDDDYTWVSDYAWGWAPFHYGRWVHTPRAPWAWIPGRTYAGAWVSWRYGYDDWPYVGWAPLAPTWCWHHGVAAPLRAASPAPFAFVASSELFASSLSPRVLSGPRASLVAAHTRAWQPAPVATSGRVVARPSVAGVGGVAGVVRVGGPPPSALRISPSTVAHLAVRPVRGAQAGRPVAAASAWSAGASRPAQGYAPAYGPPVASHFGGRFGAGFSGPAYSPSYAPAVSPRTLSGAPGVTGAPRAYYGPARVYAEPRGAPPATAWRGGSPAYYGGSAGVSRVGGAMSAPRASVRAPSAGVFHAGGGYSPSAGGVGARAGGRVGARR